MSTRALVPNANGEGSLGTAEKAWGAMYVNTPETGANDQSVPSTAWVQSVIAAALKQAKLDAHPVGSYYFSDDSTSPADLFGGTWEALPAGYTLIAQGSGTDDFGSYTYTAGQKYGERMHKLTVDELASHKHQYRLFCTSIGGSADDSRGGKFMCAISSADTSTSFVCGDGLSNETHLYATGNDQAHNNTPLSIATYGWKRVS